MLDKSEITKQTPEKSLVEPKKRSGGRNAHGEITIWHRGGGHKKQYRSIDFRREKKGFRRASRPLNTTRTARHALRCCTMPTGRSATSCIRLARGRNDGTDRRGRGHFAGKRHADPVHPPGTQLHNLELQPGKGAQAVRAAGGSAQLLSKEGDIALVKLPSGEVRKFGLDCMATIGQVGNLDHENVTYGKAGANPVAWTASDGARRGDEPGRPSARRRRGARQRQSSADTVGFPTLGAKTRRNRRSDKQIVSTAQAVSSGCFDG